MKQPKYSFDSKCFELAQHFFPGADEGFLNDVAQCVQDTIEAIPSEPDEQPGETSAVCQCHHVPHRAIDGNKCLRCGLPVSEPATEVTECRQCGPKEIAEGKCDCVREKYQR